MPLAERQPAERLPDHDAGIGDDGVEPAEAMKRRINRVR